VPDQFLGPGRAPEKNVYRRVLEITDFVSGMTDTFAVMTRERLGAV
jgi:dGTPase